MKFITHSIVIAVAAFGLVGTLRAAPPGKGPVKFQRKAPAIEKAGDASGATLKRIGPPGKGLRRH